MNKKDLQNKLTELGALFDSKDTKAQLKSQIAAFVPPEPTDSIEPPTAPVEVEAAPPALVEDDIVTRRGAGMGGVTRMKRSEYNALKE